MSAAITEPEAPAAAAAGNGHPLTRIVIAGSAVIPAWVRDLDSFRSWAKSGAMPTQGWYSYLDGELWADPSMEQFFTHNQVKFRITLVLGMLVSARRLGYFIPDRML